MFADSLIPLRAGRERFCHGRFFPLPADAFQPEKILICLPAAH